MTRARTKPAENAPSVPAIDTPEPADDGIYWETKVADAMGLPRDRVAAIRTEHFKDGVDFRTVRGAVVLTALGLARLQEIAAEEAAPSLGDHAAPEQEFPVPKGPPARARFEVVKPLPNKRLLWCVPEGERHSAPRVLVHVKDNALFMPGMKFEAIEGEAGSWQFRGRMPKRRGRW